MKLSFDLGECQRRPDRRVTLFDSGRVGIAGFSVSREFRQRSCGIGTAGTHWRFSVSHSQRLFARINRGNADTNIEFTWSMIRKSGCPVSEKIVLNQ
jgi:hypothetical protein